MSHIRAMDPKATLPWYPEIDKDLPEAERFCLMYHPLDMREDAVFNDEQIRTSMKGKKQSYEYRINQMDVQRLEKTITGWNNFVYPDNHPETALRGTSVPFSVANIALIPPDIRREFIDSITGRNRDEEAEDLGEAKTA